MSAGAPHWEFVLAFYAQPGIADACLVLQDEAGVDVVVLLFALYAARERGVVFGEEEIRVADETVGQWRREVVEPLRAVRRRMKAMPEPMAGAAKERVRESVKAVEVEAERVALGMLAQRFEGMMVAGCGGRDDAGLVARVARYFAQASGRGWEPSARIREAVETVQLRR
ncbi:MAG TPA: TIGR02444 family protein [Ramlibacter sp.]